MPIASPSSSDPVLQPKWRGRLDRHARAHAAAAARCRGSRRPARRSGRGRARTPRAWRSRPPRAARRRSVQMCTSEPVPIRISVGLALRGVAQHVGAAVDGVVGDRRPGSTIGSPWRLSTSAVGVSVCSSANCQASAVSFASAGPHAVDVRLRPQRAPAARPAGGSGRPRPGRSSRACTRGSTGMLHQRRQPHRGLHVVEEVEERRAERAQAVQVEAVDDRPHGVLAHAVVHVAAAVVAALHRAAVLDLGERRGLEVGRAADQVRHPARRPLDHLAATPCGWRPCRRPGRNVGRLCVPAVRQARRVHDQVELGRGVGVARRGTRPAAAPTPPRPAAPRSAASSKWLARLVGHVEGLVGGPAVGLLGEPHLVLAERRAVRLVGVLLVRRAVADVRAHDDERGPVVHALRLLGGALERLDREVLAHVLHVPAVGLVALPDVLAEKSRSVGPASWMWLLS